MNSNLSALEDSCAAFLVSCDYDARCERDVNYFWQQPSNGRSTGAPIAPLAQTPVAPSPLWRWVAWKREPVLSQEGAFPPTRTPSQPRCGGILWSKGGNRLKSFFKGSASAKRSSTQLRPVEKRSRLLESFRGWATHVGRSEKLGVSIADLSRSPQVEDVQFPAPSAQHAKWTTLPCAKPLPWSAASSDLSVDTFR